MSIGITTKAVGGAGDHRWLYSRHAVENSATGTLDVSAFTPTDGVIPSGTAVSEDTSSGLLVPFVGTEGQALYGFVLNDTDATADTPAAIVWHGRIRTEFLPGEFVAPAGQTSFIFD